MGATEQAEWFYTEYCAAPYNGWWVGASEEVGVLPSNNDIESFWKALKTNMLAQVRVGHRALLEHVFPQMLFLLSPDWTGPPWRSSTFVDASCMRNAGKLAYGCTQPVAVPTVANEPPMYVVNALSHAEVSPRGTVTGGSTVSMQVPLTSQRVHDFFSLCWSEDKATPGEPQGVNWVEELTRMTKACSRRGKGAKAALALWAKARDAAALHLIRIRKRDVHVWSQDPATRLTKRLKMDQSNYLDVLWCDCARDQKQGSCPHKLVVPRTRLRIE